MQTDIKKIATTPHYTAPAVAVFGCGGGDDGSGGGGGGGVQYITTAV